MTTDAHGITITASAVGAYPTNAGGLQVRVLNPDPDPDRYPNQLLCVVIGGGDDRFAYAETILVPAGKLRLTPTLATQVH